MSSTEKLWKWWHEVWGFYMVLGCAGVVHDYIKKFILLNINTRMNFAPLLDRNLCANNFMYILILNQKCLSSFMVISISWLCCCLLTVLNGTIKHIGFLSASLILTIMHFCCMQLVHLKIWHLFLNPYMTYFTDLSCFSKPLQKGLQTM